MGLLGGWRSLKIPAEELRLDVTLPTGQSFRWKLLDPGCYVGVVGKRVVALKETVDDIHFKIIGRDKNILQDEDESVLRDYFNLNFSLDRMVKDWTAKDLRFKQISPLFPGARMLRQDPLECLFSFLCSQNNHIQRIQGMVETLARDYGTEIPILDNSSEVFSQQQYYAFPTLQQLQSVDENELREKGFGYRAKYVVGTVAALASKENGGEQWLLKLRNDCCYEEAQQALCTLPGIGPKVAACVCLFSLDKHESIPVDTHVWQLACRYYTPHLKDRKSVTPKIMKEVEAAFIEVFGPMAGWAHNVLFISELAQLQDRIPEELKPITEPKKGKQKNQSKKNESEKAVIKTEPWTKKSSKKQPAINEEAENISKRRVRTKKNS